MRTKNFSLVCLWQLYPSLFFQCSLLSPPRLNSSRNLQKRKPGWWKAKFGMAKSEFQWRICSCVCLLQRFYYARQNWMENWCSAVGFWHFSFSVTREVTHMLSCAGGCSGGVDLQTSGLTPLLLAPMESSLIIWNSFSLQGTAPSQGSSAVQPLPLFVPVTG